MTGDNMLYEVLSKISKRWVELAIVMPQGGFYQRWPHISIFMKRIEKLHDVFQFLLNIKLAGFNNTKKNERKWEKKFAQSKATFHQESAASSSLKLPYLNLANK